MAPGVLFCARLLILAHLCQLVQSCFPRSIQAKVPETLSPGYSITQVPLHSCRREGLKLISGDRDFTVRSDGTLQVVRMTSVRLQRSFWVWAIEGGGQPSKIRVQLTADPPQLVNGKAPWDVARKRFKRRWSPPPFNIVEHQLPPFPKDIDLVGSDSSVNYSVYYTLQGPGVTLPPENLFSVDRNTGMVRVHFAVDREQYSQFTFEARVFDKKTGKETDRPLDITVLVDDINDNAPTFSGPLLFHVYEQCAAGTEVGVVMATDRDQENTLHTTIRYSLVTGTQLFSIDAHSGMIKAVSSSLDREVQESILVTVQIKDMDGADSGLLNTATATITLEDINDNAPTFREAIYKANIQENKADVLVLRIPVDDNDEKNSKNWNAKFVIVEGNEKGNFRIESDVTTNEGLLYVIKPLDYEKGSVVRLIVAAQNEVPLVDPAASWQTIPVELSVGDVDEGPEFIPADLILRVKDNTPNGTVLGTYQAVDPETKSGKGMKYYKVSDPGSWVIVNESTGQLTAAEVIDLESPLVTDAMYKIVIKAIDSSQKTGLGSVTLMIEDVNDNVPVVVPGTDVVVCDDEEKMGSVVIHAEDPDQPPYSTPFHFQLADGHDGKWKIRGISNTSAVLEQAEDMPRGQYKVPVLITDLQSNGIVQVLDVRVCHCIGDQCVAHRSSVSIGVWGVLAMLLALLLLLLLFLFCVFACTTKGDKLYMDDSSGGMLLKSNTEAPGEEVKSANLLLIPPFGGDVLEGSVKGGASGHLDQKRAISQAELNQQMGQQMGQQTLGHQTIYQSSRRDIMTAQGQSNFYSSGGHYGGGIYSDSTFYKQSHLDTVHTWATNGLYLDKKLGYFGGESEGRYADDVLRVYGYEGEGSLAGSVGCCSDFGDQDNLDFLDSLGSKFKTLANICTAREGAEEN